MALWDEVKARYPATQLKGLTNPESTSAATINDALGLKAQADVQADFLLYAGTTYSDTDARHVALGVLGVVKKLQVWKGLPPEQAEKEEADWIQRLATLARFRTISKVRPAANSRYTPSNPNPTSEELRPPFDEERFEGLTPIAPER